MPHARKIIVYIATSADGYIARPDGGYEWLDRPRPRGNYGMGAFVRSIDTIFWGRATYELALKMGSSSFGMFGPGIANYVFTHHPPEAPPPAGVQIVNKPLPAFVKRLRAKPGKNMWIMGGAKLIASFLDAGLIDEFSIHVIPVFIGEGIPLSAPRHRLVPLSLISSRRFADGVVHLNYRVKTSRRG